MDKRYYVYIMMNIANNVLYVGVTNDIIRRVYEHRNSLVDGFSKKYKVIKLVHFEEYGDVRIALQREKNLKSWNRDWKLELVRKSNPKYNDLYSLLADPRVKPEDDKVGA